MRRREFIMLLGGTVGCALGAPSLLAAPVAPSREFEPWGFDLTGADFATRPGDDFFRHSLGAWFDRTVIAPDQSVAGIDIVLRDTAEARIRAILEQGADGVEPSMRGDAVKCSTFYRNFMQEERAEAADASPIVPVLQRIRAANSHRDLASLIGAANETLQPSIFGMWIGIDAKDPGKYAVTIAQGGLGLPDRDYYLVARFGDKKAAYLAYIARMLTLIGWDSPAASAAAILDFESAIAEASWPLSESRDSTKTYNPMPVAELPQAMPFAWSDFMQAARLGAADRVVLSELTAIPKIAAIHARTALDTLKAWHAFHVANAAAPYLSKRFDAAHFEFYSTALEGVAEPPARWKRGVRIVNDAMGEAIGRVYVARHFSPTAKAQVADLVAQIGLAFKTRIERLAWMSPETKAKALDKLARLHVKIAYPDKWRDYSRLVIRDQDLVDNILNAKTFDWRRNVDRLNAPVDRDEWDMTPQTVNASYSSNLNEIVLPAAQLQAPYFDPAADPAVNYGGIGGLIGHELTHGFDDDGRRYDAAGVLTNWWTEADEREFSVRAAALGKQYDAYEPFPEVHVNGDLTMGENIADLGGTLIALDAYRHSLAGKPAPVRDGLTGDQRFFLAYAQSWRSKRREDALRQRLVSDPHAPEQYRVNGVARNMDEWYEAFEVGPGDKLYLPPESRVRIW